VLIEITQCPRVYLCAIIAFNSFPSNRSRGAIREKQESGIPE
jgi:hypothetical protein